MLQRHAQTLREQDEPNIDDLLAIVTESAAAYQVCQQRIAAVEQALEKALALPPEPMPRPMCPMPGSSLSRAARRLQPAARRPAGMPRTTATSRSDQSAFSWRAPACRISQTLKGGNMKLFLARRPFAVPHIVLEELGLPYQTETVDLKTKQTASGQDFLAINPKGYVPALQLDGGELLTEGPAIVQYLADLARRRSSRRPMAACSATSCSPG